MMYLQVVFDSSEYTEVRYYIVEPFTNPRKNMQIRTDFNQWCSANVPQKGIERDEDASFRGGFGWTYNIITKQQYLEATNGYNEN